MPYKVEKSGSGYKVKGPAGKTYSKHAQTHAMAVRQLRALYMHEGAADGRKA